MISMTWREVGDTSNWFKVKEGPLGFDQRINVRVQGRYVTVYKRETLSCIDAICHHAGGNLGDGPLRVVDIEDLSVTVVLCPLHRYMVAIEDGAKVFEGLEDMGGGKLGNPKMKKGKLVQMAHDCKEDRKGVYVRLNAAAIAQEDELSASTYTSKICGRNLQMSGFESEPC